MSSGKKPEVEVLSSPEGPGDKEDRAWLERRLILRTVEEGSLPHFDFVGLQKIKSPEVCANAKCSLVFALGDVESIDILSAASLMEIGMCMEFTKICDQKEHNKICNATQHAACDCVVTLCRRMDCLSIHGFKIWILKVPCEVVTAVVHRLASGPQAYAMESRTRTLLQRSSQHPSWV